MWFIEFLDKLFVDPRALPEGAFGFFHLIYLGATYAFVLMQAGHLVKDGSELLLLIPAYAGIVGSVVLPVLGSVPDGAIVLFSGLGSHAQEELSVGVGALAGSTTLMLTIAFAASVWAGRVNLKPNGDGSYIKPRDAGPGWHKLDPPSRVAGTGVTVGGSVRYIAQVMVATLLPFAVIQIPAFLGNCVELREVKHCETPRAAAGIGCVLSVLLFAWYLYDQARLASSDSVRRDKIDMLRVKAVDQHYISLRGLFPANVVDEEGHIHISASEPRFRRFLLPFFKRFDVDQSGGIDKYEFAAVVHSLGETPTPEVLDALMDHMDRDKSGRIEFDEFCLAMVELMENTLVRTNTIGDIRELRHKRDDEADEEEDEVEMPDELAHLEPDVQQARLLRRSIAMMAGGVLLIILFSKPAVGVLSQLGARTGIAPFYVAFILAPFASNGSELISSFAYASKKTEKSITIAFAALLGSVTVNNTFCMAIFLALIYFKELQWIFYAETLCIVGVELCLFALVRRHTITVKHAVIAALLYPFSIVFVFTLEYMGFD